MLLFPAGQPWTAAPGPSGARSLWALLALLLCALGAPAQAQVQTPRAQPDTLRATPPGRQVAPRPGDQEATDADGVPPEVAEELARRGLTVEQAVQQAESLGIDLSDPEQAAARARALGVPEWQVKQYLQLSRSAREPQPRQAAFETSVIEGDTVLVPREPTPGEPLGAALDTTRAFGLQPDSAALPYFGYATFQSGAAVELPSIGALDEAYVVGPGDELRLTLTGDAEFQVDLTVDTEGRIFVPSVGQYTAAGQRLGELRERVRRFLSRSYSGLYGSPPSTFLDLTLTRLRPVQVFVTGAVERPGAYTVPSGTSVFNVLYVVGGVTTDGTLRRIRVVRAGEDVAALDAYDYLLDGRTPSPIRLQQGDRLFVPPRGKTAAIRGAVRREAFYELLPGEGLAELIAFASGLEPEAYAERFQVERIVPFTERRDPSVARQVLDLPLTPVLRGTADLALEDGDRVRILSILEEGTPGVEQTLAVAEIVGAVYQPGRFEIGADVRTLRDLIAAADGLLPGAFGGRAALTRLQADGTRSFLPVPLPDVLDDVPQANVVLRPGDRLEVFAARDLEGSYTYEVAGQVLRPGERPFLEGITLYDALFDAGGLQDPEFRRTVLAERADLFRLTPTGEDRRIVRFDLAEVLAGSEAGAMPLRPGDIVRVYARRVEDPVEEELVTISGAVKDAGTFPLQANTTVEDLILQAGGFAEGAFVQAVEVTRMAASTGAGRAETLNVPVRPGSSVGPLPGSPASTAADGFRLRHGDRVYVRFDPAYRPQETVLVVGEVVFPGQYTLLRDNESLASLVERAGGLTDRAYVGGGRLLRDGRRLIVDMEDAVEGRRRADVVLQAGDEVVIPSRPNTVAVEGNVANAGLIKYVEGKRVSYYLDRAGGAGDDTESVLLTQASGATFKLRGGLFPENPVVDDGATVNVVPEPEPEGEGVDTAQVVRDTLTILTGAVTVLVPLILALTR